MKVWSISRFFFCLCLFALACDPAPECKVNGDCTKEGQACQDGKCIDDPLKCDKDEDCEKGKVCKDKQCTQGPTCPQKDAGGCCEDSHCKAGEECKDDKCVAKGCSKDEDCKADAAKPKCLGGACVAADACSADADCTDATKPKCEGGKCIAPALAKLGEECDKVSCEGKLVCYAQVGTPFCREACDPFDPICRGGTVCALIGQGKGVCLPRNNGKLEGENCAGNSCERNLFCVDWTEKLCAKPCRPDKKDCSDKELCHDFGDAYLCVPEPAQCGPGRPCTNRWKCDEKKGFCFPEQCPTVPCESGQICKLGACSSRNCCNGDPCQSGQVCNHSDGKCTGLEIKIPFCTNCLAGDTCGEPSQRCIQLSGADDKMCASECTATKKCNDPLMKCVEQKDKRWFCIPSASTCQRDRCDAVKCNDGEACLPATKKCVAIGLGVCKACSDDLQCGGPTDRCIIKKGETTGYCGLDCGGCAKCPNGYTCSDYEGGKQCLPAAGKCQ